MIRIWGNKLAICIPECINIEEGMTLFDWFVSDGMPEDCDIESMPISVWIDGTQILPSVYSTIVIHPAIDVDIYREPKGTDPFSITFALVFGAKAIMTALMPKMPSVNSGSGRGQGKDLDEASSKGNRIKVNDVIPELAGFNLRYPDVIGPPRRSFRAPREQWVEMLLCVGKGKYQIDQAKIKTGITPLAALGADAYAKVYGPGEDLSAETAHLMWYPAPEVSSTSNGASGLELTVSSSLTVSVSASVFYYNDKILSIPTGGGSFPSDWSAGLIINVGDPYVYTVSDGTGTGGRDIISGGNVSNLGFSVGELIEIQGENSGLYEVFSYSSNELQLNYEGGAAATGLAVGIKTMAIGFRGLRYKIVTFGEQALLLDRLKSNGTVDSAWSGWTSNSSNAGRAKLDNSNLQSSYRGPFPVSPDSEKVIAIEYDVFFPAGLVFFNDKSNPVPLEATHVFEYRDADLNGSWTVVSTTLSDSSLNAKGYTYRITLPYPMRAEARIKRLPSIITDDTKKSDTMLWYGLRGLSQFSKTSYPGVTMIAVYIRGGDRIASQVENLVNLECTRILPELDGNGKWGSEKPTRKISSWVGHVTRSVGYGDINLNLSELQRLENTWTARGDTYDKIVSSASTVKDNLIECLAAGFSELTIDKGQIRPVRDEPRGEIFNHMYNPQNMREPLSRDFTASKPDDFDGVDVEYTDEKTWSNLTVKCRIKNMPGRADDQGLRVLKIKIEGVHNRDKAYQYGMRVRLRQVFQKIEYSFSTEYAALNSGYGDYVMLGDNITGYGESSILKSFTLVGSVYMLVSSEPFDWSKGGVHLVAIRRQDGTVSGPYVATRLDDYRLTIQKSDFDQDTTGFYPDFESKSEPPFLQFGPESLWCYPAIITEVNPSSTKYCSVKAVNYDERVYSYDNRLADN